MDKKEGIDFLISLWTDKELELLGGEASLREQIEKTYQMYFVIFIDDKEIKEYWIKEVGNYKKILEVSNSYLIKNAFVDSLKFKFFFKKKHNNWKNLLIEKLETKKYKTSKENKYLAQETIKRCTPEQIKQLELKINDKVYSLEEQLLARWNRKLYKYEDDYQDLFQYFEKGNALMRLSLKEIHNSIDLNNFLWMAETEYFEDFMLWRTKIGRLLSKLNPYLKTYIWKQYRIYLRFALVFVGMLFFMLLIGLLF